MRFVMIAGLLLSAHLVANDNRRREIDFIAPKVSSTSDVHSPVVGSIVYDFGAHMLKSYLLSGDWANIARGNQAATSRVTASGGNGMGTTATMIRRFQNYVRIGEDINYFDSEQDGVSFTTVTPGVYAITYTDKLSALGSNVYLGISLFPAATDSPINSIPASERLAMTQSTVANGFVSSFVSLHLPSGSVVRPHSDSTKTDTSSGVQFSIVRISP